MVTLYSRESQPKRYWLKDAIFLLRIGGISEKRFQDKPHKHVSCSQSKGLEVQRRRQGAGGRGEGRPIRVAHQGPLLRPTLLARLLGTHRGHKVGYDHIFASFAFMTFFKFHNYDTQINYPFHIQAHNLRQKCTG